MKNNIETALKPLGNPRKLELLSWLHICRYVGAYVCIYVCSNIYVSMQGCYVAVCNSVKLESQFGISNYDSNTAELRLHL